MLGETGSGNASEEFEIADWNGDGLQDLVLIKKNATGTGSTEVHIYDGATNFSTPLLHTGTALGVTGPADQFEFTDWNRDGRQDLVLIKQAQTGTGTTEVHVYDGATNFSTPLLHTGTALHETGDNFEFEIADWNRDGRLDIVALKKNATGTATTEVHVLNGLTGGKSPMTQG
jgi:threonine dehydrogenase-like Zn-dependent dehydrogenase